MVRRGFILMTCFALAALRCWASEDDAIFLSDNLRAWHMPFGTVVDPVFDSPDGHEVVRYTHCGDSAIWTGHYLGGEAFRYAVTSDNAARENLWGALLGIDSLISVTGTDLLARCLVPTDSRYAAGIIAEEARHGVYTGTLNDQSFYWIGNTSRDQYSGVFFGLGVAYDVVDDPQVRGFAQAEVTRLLDYLLRHNWALVMPDGSISTVFWGRPDQQLSFLQVGRHLNPVRFGSVYQRYRTALASSVALPILAELADDHNHYFKFNLDYINLFNLLRLEENDSRYLAAYVGAYRALRGGTETHANAHFNLIDRALQGPDDARDSQTVQLLDAWITRPRRDFFVDLRSVYDACGQSDRACVIIPVPERPNTDFLWQRSPRLLYGGGAGTIETPAIDYILPYWMARFYGVVPSVGLE